jgi:tetratricopeptide (TPR) repeat protein
MRTLTRTLCHAVAVSLIGAAALAAQPPAGQDPSADLLKQGQAKLREGKHDEALALVRQALAASPDSYQANSQAGVVLDLMGQYGEARKYLAKAIEVAATDLAEMRPQLITDQFDLGAFGLSGAPLPETLPIVQVLDHQGRQLRAGDELLVRSALRAQ